MLKFHNVSVKVTFLWLFLTPFLKKEQAKEHPLIQYGRPPKIPKVCRDKEKKRSLVVEVCVICE